MTDAHARWDCDLAQALRQPDAVAAVQALDDRDVPGVNIADLDAHGLRIAALLIARLRFEKIIQGCPRGSAVFDDDREGFVNDFRRYHAEVPSTSHDAAEEWELFEGWRKRQS